MNNQDDRELAEYEELCSSWRHDDNTFDRFSAIILPLCFVGLIVSYNDKTNVPAILSCGVGLLGMFYWYCTGINHQVRADIRWERIRQIECCFRFDVHRRIHNKRQLYGIKLRHRSWRRIITLFYILAAVIVCVSKYKDRIPSSCFAVVCLIIIGVYLIIIGVCCVILRCSKCKKGENYISETENIR